MSLHVKTKGHYYAAERKRTLNPGSVVPLEKEMAEEYVKRGLGELHPGPAFDAPPPPDDEEDAPTIEKADMAGKLAVADRMVGPRQQHKAGSI